MEEKLTKECKDQLRDVLCHFLDTNDKRIMFFYLMFPEFVSRIELEGSAYIVSYNIISFFQSQGIFMMKKLINILNDHWGKFIKIEIETE